MAPFGNRRKDYSIQPPRQSTATGILTVTDSDNIDFTFGRNNLTADLTQTGVAAGTYGSPLLIPILQIDQWGRVTGATTTTFSASGIALEVNNTPNLSQTILNLTSGTDIQVVDLGGGVIEFNYIGIGGSGTVTSVSAGTGMNFTTITTSGSVAIDTTKVPYLAAGFSTGLLKWDGSAWVFDTSTYLTTISGLNISLLTNDSGYITSASLTGYVPTTRTLTINGVGYDLSADRSWTISAGTGTVTSVATGTGLTGGTITGAGTIQLNTKLAPADNLTGNAGKFLRVNSGESAVEYATVTSGESISPFLLMGG
jgi:hypothetical protein